MKLKVIKPHLSNYPNPISFKVGDALTVGKKDTEYKGWVKVKTQDGNEGWAPEQYIDEKTTPAKATSNYYAMELNTFIGEHLIVSHTLNGWAWSTNPKGQSGWVPIHTTETLST